MKTQTIRLLDVFFVGPVMVVGGRKLWRGSPLLGNVLSVLGVLTVLYNGRNYLLTREAASRVGGQSVVE